MSERKGEIPIKDMRPTVSRFFDIVGSILAFGSLFYQLAPKGGGKKIFSGNIFFTNFYFERISFILNQNLKPYTILVMSKTLRVQI
jgi:hypothetical protein